MLLWNSDGHYLPHGSLIQVHNISRRSKLNNGSPREIPMVITLHMEARFGNIIYRDARNWNMQALEKFKWSYLFTQRSISGEYYVETHEIKKPKLSRNSNGHNFSLGCPIQAHNISKRSKLNNGSSRVIQMVINFHTDVRFGEIIYRDGWNWTPEALEEFKWA